jgi:glucose-6-phosphate 1-epimerase
MSPDALLATTLPPSVRRVDAAGSLPYVEISTAAATAAVFFQGAQITRWTPAGCDQSVLFLSADTYSRAGKAIRGGVPICFPWFGDHPTDAKAPAHGFVRAADWRLVEAAETANGTVTLAFALERAAGGHPLWPHAFRITHRLSIGATLTMTLEVENTGDRPFVFEEALHSYFAVADVERVAVSGLEQTEYLDKVSNFSRRLQGVEPVRFTGETDRVYLDTTRTCRIDDPAGNRAVTVAKSNSRSTVVWNPWIERAHDLADFGDDEWRRMVCIETANVRDAAVRLEPGERHRMVAIVNREW